MLEVKDASYEECASQEGGPASIVEEACPDGSPFDQQESPTFEDFQNHCFHSDRCVKPPLDKTPADEEARRRSRDFEAVRVARSCPAGRQSPSQAETCRSFHGPPAEGREGGEGGRRRRTARPEVWAPLQSRFCSRARDHTFGEGGGPQLGRKGPRTPCPGFRAMEASKPASPPNLTQGCALPISGLPGRNVCSRGGTRRRKKDLGRSLASDSSVTESGVSLCAGDSCSNRVGRKGPGRRPGPHRRGSCHGPHRRHDRPKQACRGLMLPATVSHLPTSRRNRCTLSKPIDPAISISYRPLERSVGSLAGSPIQLAGTNRGVRRAWCTNLSVHSLAERPRVAAHEPSLAGPCIGPESFRPIVPAGRTSYQPVLSRECGKLEPSRREPGPLRTLTCGSQSRPPIWETNQGNGQGPCGLEDRQCNEPLHQRDPGNECPEQSPGQSHRVWNICQEEPPCHPVRRGPLAALSKPAHANHVNPTPPLFPGNQNNPHSLTACLNKALRISKHNGFQQVFLELFSGKGDMSVAVSKVGYGVVCVDIRHGHTHDLCKHSHQNIILGWIKSRVVCAVWLGTPCASWSRARHDLDGGGPRSKDHIFGKPNLSPADAQRVAIGNNTLHFSLKVIHTSDHCAIPTVLENPASSMMWQVPALIRLKGKPVLLDYCQFGERWRKRTRFQTWNLEPPENQLCKGHRGICSRTHKSHIILKGFDKIFKQNWTHIAEPYPTRVCSLFANCIVESVQNLAEHRRCSVCTRTR